jgi:hypothetical protein
MPKNPRVPGALENAIKGAAAANVFKWIDGKRKDGEKQVRYFNSNPACPRTRNGFLQIYHPALARMIVYKRSELVISGTVKTLHRLEWRRNATT